MPEAKVTLGSAIAKYNAGELSFENFQKIVAENGNKLAFYAINKERNPQYPEGDNRSRVGFTYNPSEHPKGRFFQSITKKAILAAIHFAHNAMCDKYDKDIFIYDDSRLNEIDEFMRTYISEKFKHAYPYKHDFMLQILDIVLGLAKEDIYYRARLFDVINEFREEYPKKIILTETEKENIDKN